MTNSRDILLGLATGDGDTLTGESQQGQYVPGKYNPGMVPQGQTAPSGAPPVVIPIAQGGSYADMAGRMPELADIAFQLRGTGGPPTTGVITQDRVITSGEIPGSAGGTATGYDRPTVNNETEPLAGAPAGTPAGVTPAGAPPAATGPSAAGFSDGEIQALMKLGLGEVPVPASRPVSAPAPIARPPTRFNPRVIFGG